MKANKLWSILTMLVLVLGVSVAFSSCGKDDDKGSNTNENTTNNNSSSLIGFWYPEKQTSDDIIQYSEDILMEIGFPEDGAGGCNAYVFKNSDTVEALWTIYTTDRPSTGLIHSFRVKGKTIYVKQISSQIYSYTKNGNTIVIPGKDDVLTIYEGQLHSNGGLVYDKIK